MRPSPSALCASTSPAKCGRGVASGDVVSVGLDPDGLRVEILFHVLTLRTPQGLAISFTAKSFQLEAMATIATYGRAAWSIGTRFGPPLT